MAGADLPSSSGGEPVVVLRLYVSGGTPSSILALANLHGLCTRYLQGRHRVEIIDVVVAPERAMADRVVMTPMLVKVAPPPEVRILGDLSREVQVVTALGLFADDQLPDGWRADGSRPGPR